MNFTGFFREGSSEERSFRIDSLRQAADGFFTPLIESVFLVVAIRFFSAGDFWKGLISASTAIGFFLSVPLTAVLNRRHVERSHVLTVLTALAGILLLAGGLAPSAAFFALAVTCSSAAFNLRQPFFSDLYGDVYPPEHRAQRIALGLRLLLIISFVSGLAYGRLLDGNISFWRYIFIFAALILVLSAITLSRLPNSDIRVFSKKGLSIMAKPFKNPLFLYIQASWMLVGFGNLWALPLKAVYLTETGRGLGYSAGRTTLILAVIPVAMKLLVNPIWARLYSRLSFPALRISINVFFMISTPLFFLTDSLWVIILSAVLYGIAASGSPFIWQLWVTRIVPPEETRIYQSVHAFLAGVRGIAAPFIGLAILRGVGFRSIGFISAFLTLASILMILPLMRPDRKF